MTSDYPLDEDGNYSQKMAKRSTAGENNLDSPVIRRIYGLGVESPKNELAGEVSYLVYSISHLFGNKVHAVRKAPFDGPEGLENLIAALKKNPRVEQIYEPNFKKF